MRPLAGLALSLVLVAGACAELGLPPASFTVWLSKYGQTFSAMSPPAGVARPDPAEFAEANLPRGAQPGAPMYGEVGCVEVCGEGNGLTEDGVTRRRIWLLTWTAPDGRETWIVVDANERYTMVVGP